MFRRYTVTVLFAIGFVFLLPCILAAQVTVTGQVVEWRTNNGISSVTVDLRYSSNGRVATSTTTDRNGNYSLRASDSEDFFYLTYKPSDTNRYSTNGRSRVRNDAKPKEIDTVGLVNYGNQRNQSGASTAAGDGANSYASAGGDSNTAQNSLESAMREIGRPRFEQEIRQNPPLYKALMDKGLFR